MTDDGNRPRLPNEPQVFGRPPPTTDWYEDETSLRKIIIRELQRLKRRTKAQPVRVLLVAGLLTVAALAWLSTKARLHSAEVILKVTQGTLSDDKGTPLPNRELHEYIYSYVLNKQNLEDKVIREYFTDTYEKFGLDEAITEFREGLSVGVFRNYFYFSVRHESESRALRISLEYSHKDPEFAYKIASILANMVVNNESARRLREARFAAEDARRTLVQLEEEAKRRQDQFNIANFELIRAQVAGDDEAAAAAKVIMDEIDAQIRQDASRLEGLQREQQQIEFRYRLEESHLAYIWEIASAIRPRVVPPPGPIRLTAMGVVLFCVFVPMCAIGFGTLDTKIHDTEDVTRLGLPAVGHVPSFSGDAVGSLVARGALGKRGLFGYALRNRRLRDNRVA